MISVPGKNPSQVEMARALGVSRTTIEKDVAAVKANKPGPEDVRAELAALMVAPLRVWAKQMLTAELTDRDAVNAFAKIYPLYAQLTGLDIADSADEAERRRQDIRSERTALDAEEAQAQNP